MTWISGIFKDKAAAALEKTVGVINKAVVDKDKRNELNLKAIEISLQDRQNARKNTTGVARWVRAFAFIIMLGFYFGMDYYFLKWLLVQPDLSIELKATFFFKVLADVTMILMVSLQFYFGNSDKTSESTEEISKTVKKLN